MVEALGALPLPPLSLPGQQPQADPGLLPRPRASRTSTAAIRHDRQARQAAAPRASPTCSSSEAGPPPSRPSSASSWPRSGSPTPRFVDAVRALGVERRAARRGARRARRRASRAARDAVGERVTVEANLRIARGLDYYTGTVSRSSWRATSGSKSVGGGGRYDALADRRPDDVPRRRHLLRRLAHPGPAASPTGCSTASRPVPSAVLVALADEESRGQRARSPTRCARRGHPLRGRAEPRRSSASRSATPSGAASRTSGSPGRRRARPGQGHPLRRPGRRRRRPPGPHPPTTSARTSSSPEHRRRHP